MRQRVSVLKEFTEDQSVIDALLSYNESAFSQEEGDALSFPLPSEPHVADWERYIADASESGPFEALKRVFPQFHFPIKNGMGSDPEYRAATLRGEGLFFMSGATGLELQQPHGIEIRNHPTPAGEIPVIVVSQRADFVSLVRAITMKNEPKEVPDSMGAVIVGGYNNWERIQTYKKQWRAEHPDANGEDAWKAEFSRLIPQKERYKDRFIVLSRGPYSGVDGSSLGLSEAEWLEKSLTIRLEHECAHYFTRRVFSSMRNNVLDEIIADYMGIVGALGSYRSDWFLRFVGLTEASEYNPGGRLENYRGDLSDDAFQVLGRMVVRAAANLEQFDRDHLAGARDMAGKARVLSTLSKMCLELLAADDAGGHLLRALDPSQRIESG